MATSPAQNESDPKFQWDFTHIYAHWQEWQHDFELAKSLTDKLESYKGSLKKDYKNLLALLKLLDDIEQLLHKVYAWPALQKSLDNRDNSIQAKMQEVTLFLSDFTTKTSWINPEIMTIPEETCMNWIDENEELKVYRFNIHKIYHQKEHILPDEMEKLLSYFSNTASTASNTYTMLTTADVKFPQINLGNGKKTKLTHAVYSHILATSHIRADRKKAAERFYPLYADKKNSLAAIYKGICDKNVAFARSRNFPGALEAKLHKNHISPEVYHNLVTTVGEHTRGLQKYHELRARYLNLTGDYHNYDSRLMLVETDKTYDFDEARNLVLNSVLPLGKEYNELFEQALNNGWIDVFEREGKSSGAYSMGVYGVHPFILMNYNGTQDHVFTLAHEMGHSLHTMLSEKNQPFNLHEYTIFVAEVASTFNERLLLDHMMSQATDIRERAALLQQSIENITGTFFTQTMFADFELQAHQLTQENKPITADILTELCEQLDKKYYGDSVFTKDKPNIFWTRIPHFYRSPFYVYQYATSFAASARLYESVKAGIINNDPKPLESYLNLLKSGGSNYPVEQLRLAGADLTQKETILAVIRQLDEQVNELEQLLTMMSF